MDEQVFRHGMSIGAIQILFIVGYILIFIVPIWKIVSKAGYSGAWSLLMIIPVLNVIMLWVFAFSRWPNTERA